MNQLRRIAKSLLPLRSKRLLRTAHRDFVFGQAMRRLMKAPEACTQPGNPVIIDLAYGWGHKPWWTPGKTQDEYLEACVEHALSTNGSILECGSGLSTIVVGAIARRRGLSHWALEHTPEWASKVQAYLDKYQIDSVVLCTAPLKDYGDYSWYEPPLESMPDRFDLVVCDGPPGRVKGGRYGLVPVMRPRIKPGCVILLDDAHRKKERAIAQRWVAELGASCETLGRDKPYLKMTVIE